MVLLMRLSLVLTESEKGVYVCVYKGMIYLFRIFVFIGATLTCALARNSIPFHDLTIQVCGNRLFIKSFC